MTWLDGVLGEVTDWQWGGVVGGTGGKVVGVRQ